VILSPDPWADKEAPVNTRIGALVLFILPAVVTGCGGGGGGGTTIPIVVFISPSTANLSQGAAQSFTATVTGTSNLGVNWAVQEGAAGGSITSMGVYTAPNKGGTFHVIATSQADTSKSATATVTVATLVVLVTPPTNVLGPLGVRNFTATVNTSLNTGVTWSVQEAAGGAITTGGQYTAPNTTGGPFHVVATSAQDSSKTGIASVTIVPSGFRPTGNMSTGRVEHTATLLLPSGKVLIAGGDSCSFINYYQSCPLDSAEVYDPVAGTFATTGKMSVTRFFHTATLLANGKVLVTGGHDASAELYDPTSGTFAATGSMSVGRNSHTATQLASGKVLIAGGQTVNGGALATAELYDPTAGTFTPTGSMAAGRTSHTATLLANGMVLIAGGSTSANATPTTELYDPAKGIFTAANGMVSPRIFHTAMLLSNGNVLVTGGIANLASGVSLPSAEVYDVVAGTFTATTGPMMTARDSHFAVLLANGTVLVAGGSSFSSGVFTAELYNTASGTFTETGGMETSRALAAAVLLLDGRVFVSGGSDTISAELYK
jgi:hypothetical protein